MVESTLTIRRPAVAGTFYPSRAERLQAEVDRLLAEAKLVDLAPVRALIAPHAGYRYSGSIAASAFRQLQACPRRPSHRLPPGTRPLRLRRQHGAGAGRLLSDAAWQCGSDQAALADLAHDSRTYQPLIQAHEPEHCLEVELPFLQTVLGDFELVAMLCGEPPLDHIAADLAARLGPDHLVVVSSDLSHFHTYEQAQVLDRRFLGAVLDGDLKAASQGEACGLQPILILMRLAQLKGWRPTLLDYRNSGDTGGDRYRVVGYAALAYTVR